MSGQPSLSKSAATAVIGYEPRRRGDAGLPADVGERAVAVVVKELHGSGRQAARPAVHRHALPVAVRVLAGLRQLLERRVQVVRDEQIEAAVAVVVDPGAAGAVAHVVLQQARLRGHVGERAVAVVAIEHVLAVVGDEEIVEAVVVVVADGHRRGPARSRQPGLLGHVGEGAVAVVLVEAIGRARRRAFEARAAQHEDVEPAVVVVVEERHAAARPLR